MKTKIIIFAVLLAGLVLVSCRTAGTLQASATETPTKIPIPTETSPAPAVTILATQTLTATVQSATLGMRLDYPQDWYAQQDPASEPYAILITSYNPESPPHKLEWDSQTVSIGILEKVAGSVPADLHAWTESARQTAKAAQLEIFREERITLAGSIPAARLTLVSGSGGIIDQVLVVVNGRSYEVTVQGNFDLAKSILDTWQQAPSLKPPDSDSPVSGICAQMEGEVVEITLTVDGPAMPRCVRVTAGQKLKFINGKDHSVQLNLGSLQASLPQGGEALLDLPVGEYLAPGVHLIEGAEIILMKDKDAFTPTIEIPPSP